MNLKGEDLISSAAEALAIGQLLGEKVILMSTSTGSTLSIYLAAEFPDLVDGVICYSPNIALYDSRSWLITDSWGLQIMRLLNGSKFRTVALPPEADPYWTLNYRLEALVEMKQMLDYTMTAKTFEKMKAPLFVGYWYKNEEEHDKTVSIPAMKEMFNQVGTPEDKKVIRAFSTVDAHVLASDFRSKDIDVVISETFDFVDRFLCN